MPTTVKVSLRPSTGKNSFKFNALFDMERTKSLLSEDVEHLFGDINVITYPGPVANEDANGQPLHFVGEMTFKITINERTTTVSAWVTNDIQPGQLILGSGILEDLGLQLYDIPDILSPSGHVEDTRTMRDPRGSSPVTRSSKQTRCLLFRDISDPHSYPPNVFLIPFKYGFHRKIVIGSKGRKWTIYYINPDRERIRTKKEAGPYIKNSQHLQIRLN